MNIIHLKFYLIPPHRNFIVLSIKTIIPHNFEDYTS